ncbi:MAG: CDP-glucose 4,6-dehydratase [Alphaproteobacteria bacterium]
MPLFPSLLDFERPLAGRRIFVTGHTGFTGGWACLWLKSIGAEVAGLALRPATNPALYDALGLSEGMQSVMGDICDAGLVAKTMGDFQPEIVLHLAAQPLVRRSYREPVATFLVNAIGTAHVLEAARLTPSVKAAVCITTDKVYKNNEESKSFRESDPLGGKDPYSASKAAAEMVIDSYAASFGKTDGSGLAIATARGGNIIGGGDWSEDRLIPDYVRAVINDGKLTLRYPQATRPWQHVLALVQGYIMLMAGLLQAPERHARAWNLGPLDPQAYSVRQVLEIIGQIWKAPKLEFMENPLAEAQTLALDSSLAREVLGWNPAWDTRRMIAETAAWYKGYYKDPKSTHDLTLGQIETWRAGLMQGVPAPAGIADPIAEGVRKIG